MIISYIYNIMNTIENYNQSSSNPKVLASLSLAKILLISSLVIILFYAEFKYLTR